MLRAIKKIMMFSNMATREKWTQGYVNPSRMDDMRRPLNPKRRNKKMPTRKERELKNAEKAFTDHMLGSNSLNHRTCRKTKGGA